MKQKVFDKEPKNPLSFGCMESRALISLLTPNIFLNSESADLFSQ
jgi:hypothetical protein